ncbi:DUF3579 domain-containing protein [Thiohalorhabdus methylotrophus]|uniref:DUF3579 domain-containing protein n=1 Tax=Thiohalorhabdus methylotrophus TaxID=3242694 RepID=A0ABV4TVD4_9GAMM
MAVSIATSSETEQREAQADFLPEMSDSEGEPRGAASKDEMIVIEGVTLSGGKFRPSDWVERFAGNAASFGEDNRLHYSPHIKPTVYNGVKGLLVDPELRNYRPELFQQLVKFVNANELRIPDAKGVPELEQYKEQNEA